MTQTQVRLGKSHKPALPFVQGSDVAGIVEKVGSKVKKFKVLPYFLKSIAYTTVLVKSFAHLNGIFSSLP